MGLKKKRESSDHRTLLDGKKGKTKVWGQWKTIWWSWLLSIYFFRWARDWRDWKHSRDQGRDICKRNSRIEMNVDFWRSRMEGARGCHLFHRVSLNSWLVELDFFVVSRLTIGTWSQWWRRSWISWMHSSHSWERRWQAIVLELWAQSCQSLSYTEEAPQSRFWSLCL